MKWGAKIVKPAISGTWFNLTYSSNKYSIGNIVDKFIYNSSEITRYFFVSVKTSITHGVYTPYVKYAYSLVSKDCKIKKQVSFFERQLQMFISNHHYLLVNRKILLII